MINNGDTIAVGVSGGKDSLALLQVLNNMTKTHRFQIIAVTIDEGIPGYRDEALGIVKDVCDKLKVEHKVYPYQDLFDVTLSEALDARGEKKGSEGMSSCSICGTLRRRALDIAAKDVGADAVATGHNLDDTLQTFMINMLSGDTTKIGWMHPGGLSSSSSSNGSRRIKPFCEIYESEIVFFAFASGLPFQEEPCPHMNEGIRTEIRRFLNSLEDGHSGIKNSMYRSILKMSQTVAAATTTDSSKPKIQSGGVPHKQKKRCLTCGNDCTGAVCSACSMLAVLGGQQQ